MGVALPGSTHSFCGPCNQQVRCLSPAPCCSKAPSQYADGGLLLHHCNASKFQQHPCWEYSVCTHQRCGMQVLHMMMGLERLDRITMFMDEVASMPLGGGLGLSGRLDSHDLGPAADAPRQSGSQPGHWPQQQHPSAVEQLRNSPAGPSALGNKRSSMPMLPAPPPPATTGGAASEAVFPLNPHRSYDEEWGTMPSGGGHDSDSDVFLTPHAQSEADHHRDGAGPSPQQQQAPYTQPAAFPASPQSQPLPQSPASSHLGGNPSPSQPWLQPHRPPPEPPHHRHSPSAPVAPPSAPPSTPERPHPSAVDKFGSPQIEQQQPPQVYHRSPSSLLSRASARIRVALEASEALSKVGPADPPPRQPGLPPSSGHRRTSSHQVQLLPVQHHMLSLDRAITIEAVASLPDGWIAM